MTNTIRILILTLAISFSFRVGLSQKIDTIIHINGNVLTGDLKKMNYGVVSWNMDGLGTNNLEEPKIRTMKSIKQFEIKLKNGMIYFGSLDTSNLDHHVYIVITNGRELVNINDIVEIYPIRKSFWRRTTGKFSVGINYTKGSEIATMQLSGYLDYKKRRAYYKLSWNTNNTFNFADDSLTATKADVDFAWQHSFRNNWYLGAFVGASQNSQLGYKLRLDLTGLGIKDLAYNNWNRLWTGAGLSVQRETSLDGSSIANDLAGVVTAFWKVYKYTRPKVWVDTDVSFIPYITGNWRYRINYNLNPQISVVADDLKVGLSFYYSYDSRPPADASSTFDWGINFELSYKLH
jgi:hypothetical protein